MANFQNNTTVKYCNGCARNLPHSEFHKRNSTASRLATRCKECASAQSRKWRYSPAGRAFKDGRRKGRPPIEQQTDRTLKRCTSCSQEKLLCAFGAQKAGKFGVAAWCRACASAKHKEYAQRPEVQQQARERHKSWQQDPKNKERIKGYARKYREKNWKKVRDLHYRWRKEHPEEWKAIHKRRYYKDVEATRARDRARRAKKWIENPEQIKMWLRLANHRRKARKLNAKGECSKVQFLAKCDYHGWRCIYCKIELTLATVTLDHRQPLSKGGSNWPANIAPACGGCNSMKTDRSEASFRELLRLALINGWQPKAADKSKQRGRKPLFIQTPPTKSLQLLTDGTC